MQDSVLYTLSQCCQMLRVNNRQLDRLLRDASISREMLVTPSNDKRITLISQEQLDQLRQVQGADLVETRKTVTARTLQERITALEIENESLRRENDALRAANVQNAHVSAYDGQEMALPIRDDESISHHPQRVAIPTRIAPIYHPATRSRNDTLPEGYISIYTFCKLYGYSPNTLNKARKSGRIPTHEYQGDGFGWKEGRGYVRHAFDAQDVIEVLKIYPPRTSPESEEE